MNVDGAARGAPTDERLMHTYRLHLSFKYG
jgi:hypothetical protein